MKLQLTIDIDGNVTGNVISEVVGIPTPTPTPTPVPSTPVLPTDFGEGSIDEQVGRLLQFQFDHPEFPNSLVIDGNPVGQPGQPPAVRFTTAGGKLRVEVPLLKAAADAGLTGGQFVAVREALPIISAIKAQGAPAPDLTKLWETTPCTLDPGSMSFLLAWQGGNVNGVDALTAAKAYRVVYYKRWGKQAPPPAPRNPEAAWIADAELAQIIAS